MKKNELKNQYDDITSLYDIADELVAITEKNTTKKVEELLSVIEPLVSDIADASDILADEYINVLDKPARKKTIKTKIEKALRHIFTAIDNYRAAAKESSRDVLAALSKFADPLIIKLQKQAEKIMIIFMRLMEISLDRIMRKQELEAFRRSHSKILSSMQQQIAH